jgi:hypothetical protein
MIDSKVFSFRVDGAAADHYGAVRTCPTRRMPVAAALFAHGVRTSTTDLPVDNFVGKQRPLSLRAEPLGRIGMRFPALKNKKMFNFNELDFKPRAFLQWCGLKGKLRSRPVFCEYISPWAANGVRRIGHV